MERRLSLSVGFDQEAGGGKVEELLPPADLFHGDEHQGGPEQARSGWRDSPRVGQVGVRVQGDEILGPDRSTEVGGVARHGVCQALEEIELLASEEGTGCALGLPGHEAGRQGHGEEWQFLEQQAAGSFPGPAPKGPMVEQEQREGDGEHGRDHEDPVGGD